MKNTKVALVGLVSDNTEKYIITSKCGRFQNVIINPAWVRVMEKRLSAEHFHEDWTSYTIYCGQLARVTEALVKTLRVERQIIKFRVERGFEYFAWFNELKKVDPEMYDMYGVDDDYAPNREESLEIMRFATKGYNVESVSDIPVLKRNVWIAPADSKYFDLQITKGECFQHPEERIKWIKTENDLDVIRNYVQVKYYELLNIEDAKLESEMDRYIKATAEEIADINPDWLGHESFEENLVSLMDIKNRVGEEVYQRALEVAF